MQGTVRIFDSATRAGSVLLDDGTELAYDGAAFDAGGLRFARPGQRVALRVNAAGRITALTLATLPLPSDSEPSESEPSESEPGEPERGEPERGEPERGEPERGESEPSEPQAENPQRQ